MSDKIEYLSLKYHFNAKENICPTITMYTSNIYSNNNKQQQLMNYANSTDMNSFDYPFYAGGEYLSIPDMSEEVTKDEIKTYKIYTGLLILSTLLKISLSN